MENETIKLGIYRIEHNQPLNAKSQEYQKRRKEVIHDIFNENQNFKVEENYNWEWANDKEPHEFVELTVELLSNPHVQAVALPVVGFVGGILGKVVTDVVADSIKKYLIPKLWKAQEEEKIDETIIKLSDGAEIRSKPVDSGTQITVKKGKKTETQIFKN